MTRLLRRLAAWFLKRTAPTATGLPVCAWPDDGDVEDPMVLAARAGLVSKHRLVPTPRVDFAGSVQIPGWTTPHRIVPAAGAGRDGYGPGWAQGGLYDTAKEDI